MIAVLDSVLYEALPYSLVGFGIILTYRYLRLIDLTFAASFVVGPAIAGAMLVQGASFGFSMLVSFAAVIALAATTLTLMWLLEIEGLLAGLLTSFGGFAVALIFTQGTLSLHEVTTPLDALKAVDYSWVEGVLPLHPSQIVMFSALVLAAKLIVDWFLDSELGLAFRAMEDERSRNFLLASLGISEWSMLGIGIVCGNVLCGAAGTLVMLKEGQVTANRGFDALITVIAAYLLGRVLFERSPTRANRGALPRLFRRVAIFKPTTATLLGLLFYFLLLSLVSRTELPSSTPRLLMLAVIVASFLFSRWSDILSRWATARSNRTYLVSGRAAFEASVASVEYPGFPTPIKVIRDLNITLPPHVATQLRGANGSGKSTLLRYLAGLLPGKGIVSIPSDTTSRRRHVPDRRPFVGYVSQDAQLASSATLSVLENLALFRAGARARAWRKWRSEPNSEIPPTIKSLANRAGNELAGNLSGGQRQVLNIAGLVVRRFPPSVVLLDEPLTHLDEVNASACLDLVERLISDGHSLLIVQHELEPGRFENASESRKRLSATIGRTLDIEKLQVGGTTKGSLDD
ncbi:MAG: ATP-binding cassette domain-containing protein [Proteobacteria bacterium]|nr:ATP-binding cassette domain-containing protein [Pseudomonadota bacterium]